MKITKSLVIKRVRPLVMKVVKADEDYSYLAKLKHGDMEVDRLGLEASGSIIGDEYTSMGVFASVVVARWQVGNDGGITIRLYDTIGRGVRRVINEVVPK